MIKPLGNCIVCKPVLTESETSGGILLEQKVIPQKGECIAVGPGAMKKDGTRNGLRAKVGDIVYFPKNQFVEVETEQGVLYMMNDAALSVLQRKK